MTVPSNWYENFFHGVALDLWRKAVSDEQTKAEPDFLVKTLECASGSRLLDVPCGNGRHSLELARRELRMTGLDISEQFIEEAVGGDKTGRGAVGIRSRGDPFALACIQRRAAAV